MSRETVSIERNLANNGFVDTVVLRTIKNLDAIAERYAVDRKTVIDAVKANYHTISTYRINKSLLRLQLDGTIGFTQNAVYLCKDTDSIILTYLEGRFGQCQR